MPTVCLFPLIPGVALAMVALLAPIVSQQPLSAFLGSPPLTSTCVANPPFTSISQIGAFCLGVDTPGSWTSAPIRFSDCGPFQYGIGMHSAQAIVFDLAAIRTFSGAPALGFAAIVGIDPVGGGGQNGARFVVQRDGVTAFTIDVPNSAAPSVPVHVDITGVRFLTLRTQQLGAYNGNHACWGGAILLPTPVVPQASATAFGAGCAGSVGVPTLSAVTQPQLGETFTVRLQSAAIGACVFVLGFSNTQWGAMMLPASLAFNGLGPACNLYTSVDAVEWRLSPGTADYSLSVPCDPIYLGLRFYLQSAAVDSGVAWPTPFVVSNAVSVTWGY